jgi:hypothetical protein
MYRMEPSEPAHVRSLDNSKEHRMNVRVLTAASIGGLAAACQSPNQQNDSRNATPASTPPANATTRSNSEKTCLDYGLTPEAAGFDQCVSRERTARTSGRVSRVYTEASLTRDAQDACYSYGLQPRTDRCVSREVDARHFRAEATEPATPPYRHDQNGNWIDSRGYRVDANGYRILP